MRWLVATLAIVTASPPAEACASKENELVFVVGMVGNDLVTIELAVREDSLEELPRTEWSGDASLRVGSKVTLLGSIDPKLGRDREMKRLLAEGRRQASTLAGLIPAVQVSAKSCGKHPKLACDGVALDRTGTTLAAGSLTSTLPNDGGAVVGVVRYRVGTKPIIVANLGSGDTRWASTFRICDGRACRVVTSLHHGHQADVVLGP
jgi:hypothetical protein